MNIYGCYYFGGVVNELMRRCWHPKDLEHVRPTLEQLVALGVLDRAKEKRRRGKGLRWVYRKGSTPINQLRITT
jgi:hypothetical protein